MNQRRSVVRSSRSRLLSALPTLLYFAAFAGAATFALTHAPLAWQLTLGVSAMAVIVAIVASVGDLIDLGGIADWDPSRRATMSCVVLGLSAAALTAIDVVMQRSAYFAQLPSIVSGLVPTSLQGKPDVMLALILTGGSLAFSIAARVLGRGVTRERVIRLRVEETPTLGRLAIVRSRSRRAP